MSHLQNPTESDASAPGVDVSIILPTFNERDNILDLIAAIDAGLRVTSLRSEILVVDDSSPDGTAELVQTTFGLDAEGHGTLGGREEAALRLIVRTTDKGLARSIHCGLESARGRTLVVMDTDFNHPPEMIPQMIDLLRYYDLVIGSRFVMRGGMEDALRYRLSFLYNVFIRFLLHTQIQDNLSGYFAVRRERLFELENRFDRIFFGYGDYFMRLLLLAWRSEWRILEVPVFYILRRHGDSKTGFWRIFRDYTAAVIRLRLFGI